MSAIFEKLSSAFQNIINKAYQAKKKQVRKLELNNCKNLSEAFKFVKFDDSKSVLLVETSIEDNFGKFKPQDLTEINKKCKNKSIVLFLAFKNSSKFSIFWKSKELDHFLFLKPYTDEFTENDKKVYEFIVNVLADSLNCGHLGLDKRYQISLDTNQVDIFQIADYRGSNLLSIARETNNVNIESKFESLKLYLLDQNRGPH